MTHPYSPYFPPSWHIHDPMITLDGSLRQFHCPTERKENQVSSKTSAKRQPKFHPYMNEMTVELDGEPFVMWDYDDVPIGEKPVKRMVQEGRDKAGRKFFVPVEWFQSKPAQEPKDGTVRKLKDGRVAQRQDSLATDYYNNKVGAAHWFLPGNRVGLTWDQVRSL